MNNICNKNDFTIKLRLSDKDGVVLPYTQFDWDIWFYTTKNKPFRTYCKNGVLNAGTTIVGEYLYITVNGFDWGYSGRVYLKVFTTFANALYVDGKETFSNNPYLVTSFAITDGFSVVDAADEDDAMVIVANVEIEEDLVIPFRVGLDGKNVYVAYASDANGTNFSLTPADNLHYIAFLNIAETITDLTPDDFEGLWNMYLGKGAFELWLLDNEGATYQDYLDWVRKPATDAAEEIGELEESIENAEALRVQEENNRVSNENIREENEGSRVLAEEGRESDFSEALLEVQTATTNAINATNDAIQAIENAELATENTVEAINNTVLATNAANNAANNATDAANEALETAAHPTYIGEDFYVYQWDSENDVYVKTSIYVKGWDAHSPMIGENENWFVWDDSLQQYVDSTIRSYGRTAYESALLGGFVGTEEEFYIALAEVINKVDKVAGKSLIDDTEIEKLANYPVMDVLAENAELKYLNELGNWATIAIGAGGYAGNLYFTNVNSDVAGYKNILYLPESSITELSGTVNASEGDKLLRTYLYPYAIATTVIDAGVWVSSFRAKVSSAVGITRIKFEAFVRHINGTETTLFSTYSSELNNTEYDVIRNQAPQSVFNILSTDRLGVRIYVNTTHNNNITVYTTIGDGDASYFTTPLAFRHDQLRDKNGNTDFQHITSAQVDRVNNASLLYEGSSDTAMGTDTKVVTVTGLTAYTKGYYAITLTNGNSAAAMKVNINSLGTKDVKLGGVAVNKDNCSVAAGGLVILYYNGTDMILTGGQKAVYTTSVQSSVVDTNTILATGDGQGYILITPELDGCSLVGITATVSTASTSGLVNIQLRKNASTDMLSTALTIDANETSSTTALTPAVINASYKVVTTGDIIWFDIDSAGTGTKGLVVTPQFQKL